MLRIVGALALPLLALATGFYFVRWAAERPVINTDPALFPAVGENGRWGYIDRAGEWVIPPRYVSARPFVEGYADVVYPWSAVFSGDPAVMATERRGVIDICGRACTDASVCVVGPLRDGLAPAVRARDFVLFGCTDGLVGYIDASGEWAIAPRFASAWSFSEGLAVARLPEGRYGYIEQTGEWAISPQFESARDFGEGVGVVRHHGKFALVDADGVLTAAPSDVEMLYPFKEGLSLAEFAETRTEGGPPLRGVGGVKRDGTWAFKLHGAECFDQTFSEGLTPLRMDGKYGYIDKQGVWVIAPDYVSAEVFSEGLAAVAAEGWQWRYIDGQGNTRIGTVVGGSPGPFKDRLAQTGVQLDAQGETVVSCAAYIDASGKVVWERGN